MAAGLVTELLVLLPSAAVILVVASSIGATTGGLIDWLIDPSGVPGDCDDRRARTVAPLVSVWWSAW
jgi:hypothetical protein